jgi:hypothetical protein
MKRSKPLLPKPPAGLSKPAVAWWVEINSAWVLDGPALLTLEVALQAFDRMGEARTLIAKDGPVIQDRFNRPKVHPATFLERDSRNAMLAALKQLNLGIEPLGDRPGPRTK